MVLKHWLEPDAGRLARPVLRGRRRSDASPLPDKESITVAYALGAGEVEPLDKIGTTKADIERLSKHHSRRRGASICVYEVGPCCYGRDLSPVYVPSVEDEAFRDLARAWVSAKDDLQRARQRLKAFLLSHSVRYNGRADWGPMHRRWLSAFSFDSPWQHLAFEEFRRAIEDRLAQCDRLQGALREALISWRFYPAVLDLQAMRGAQFATAVGMLAELRDLSRVVPRYRLKSAR